MIRVQVVQQYVPALQSKIPSYGVSSSVGQALVVALSDKTPTEVLPLLEAELSAKLLNFVPVSEKDAALFAERLTHDFLTAHALAGNLRFDKVSATWRWMGPR